MKATERQKLNEEKTKDVLLLIEKGFEVALACKIVGISKPTFYHWKRNLVHNVSSFVVLPSTLNRLYAKRLKQELAEYGLPLTIDESENIIQKVLGVAEHKRKKIRG